MNSEASSSRGNQSTGPPPRRHRGQEERDTKREPFAIAFGNKITKKRKGKRTHLGTKLANVTANRAAKEQTPLGMLDFCKQSEINQTKHCCYYYELMAFKSESPSARNINV